jgi:hypothetical protein
MIGNAALEENTILYTGRIKNACRRKPAGVSIPSPEHPIALEI